MTPEGWRKIDRGLFESADGQWRVANPWRLTTELRHRWLVAERRCDESGWNMHDGDRATVHDRLRLRQNPPTGVTQPTSDARHP